MFSLILPFISGILKDFGVYIIIGLVCITGYFYISNLQNQLKVSELNFTHAIEALDESNKTIKTLQYSINEIKNTYIDLMNKMNKLGNQSSVNKQKLEKIVKNNVSEPNNLTIDVNRIQKDHNRCIELASGATPDENETNSICPYYFNK